ncbi:MAG: energy transducer TonB [Rhodospirillales bacterium]|nr:energy transducer TonB [Rhodospirillales bacterium]
MKPEPPKPEVAKAEPKPKPEPPKPETKTFARAEPEPEPKPQAKPRPPEAKPEAKPEPKPEPKPEQKPERAQAKPEPKAEAKPSPPVKTEPSKTAAPPAPAQGKAEPADDFASVMKTVGDLKHSEKTEAKPAPQQARKTETTGDPEFGAQVAQALRSAGPTGNKSSLPVTASEIDAVRRQIERCWNLPAGVKDAAGELVVSIRVEMNADGTPRSAVIDGSSRGQGNPMFQPTADSARRAVLNPRCHPFKLPPDKYERWRTMTLIFNPRDMAGT